MEWLFVVIPIVFLVVVTGAIIRALALDYRERRAGEVSLPGGLEGEAPSKDARRKAEPRSSVKASAPVNKKPKSPRIRIPRQKKREGLSGDVTTLEKMLENQRGGEENHPKSV